MDPKSSDKCLFENEAEGGHTPCGAAHVKPVETDVLRLQNATAARG